MANNTLNWHKLMTVCKAQSGGHQVHYASFRFLQVLLPCLQMRSHTPLLEMCMAGSSHCNTAQAFGRLPTNLPCVHSKRGTSRKCWILKKLHRTSAPWKCQKSKTEISVPYVKYSKTQISSAACLPRSAGWLLLLCRWCEQDERMQHEKYRSCCPEL